MNILTWLADVLGADRYHPSTIALASDPVMKILFVSGWLAVFFACTGISLSIFLNTAPRITISRRAAVMFGVLVLLLGLNAFMSSVTLFVAVYRLKVVVLAIAAALANTLMVLTVGQLFNIRVDPEGEA